MKQGGCHDIQKNEKGSNILVTEMHMGTLNEDFDCWFIMEGIKEARGGKRMCQFKGNVNLKSICKDFLDGKCPDMCCPCKNNNPRPTRITLGKRFRDNRVKKKDTANRSHPLRGLRAPHGLKIYI